MHTPVEFYVKIPVDLFRGGTPTGHKFDYLRTMPPRTDDQVYDVKIDQSTGFIDHKSGGLSLFRSPDFAFGYDWWVIPAGTFLPAGFTVSMDLTNGKFRGHYSIRALQDMHEMEWRKRLLEWANAHAVHIKNYRKEAKNV